MSGFILGEKADQSQQFTENGERIPVTSIKTSPCYLIGFTDQSVKLAFGKAKNIKKPQQGEVEKAGVKTPLRFLKEFKLRRFENVSVSEEDGKKVLVVNETKLSVGDEIKPSLLFKIGDKVDVVGTSKGKGFQGAVRRHGFGGGPKTHGQSDRWRAPGSIGSGTTPGRINKGKRMAGRMGGDTITVKNLQVVGVTDDQLTVKGLVPGYKKAMLQISSYTHHASAN